MKLVLQRVSAASVTVESGERRSIGPGLAVLAGFTAGDDERTLSHLAGKMVNLRIFEDANGQMNRSLLESGGGCLIVSQFTLYANSKKGRRPSFIAAAPPEVSEPLYRRFVDLVAALGVPEVQTGEFGDTMQVSLVNDGPVTIILDSEEILPQKTSD